jgi:hypothetical protein
MVISRPAFTSLKNGDLWKVYGPFENCDKIIMIRVHTKKGIFSKKANFREQWPYSESRVFLDRNQDGFINHARSDRAP